MRVNCHFNNIALVERMWFIGFEHFSVWDEVAKKKKKKKKKKIICSPD